MENSAVIVENVGILLIGALSCVCCVAWLLNSDIACISKPFICLLLLMKVISVAILWLLWLRNSSNTILAYNHHNSSCIKSWLHVGDVIGSLCNKYLKFHHTAANWFDCLFCLVTGKILTYLWVFRVRCQHHHSSDGHQSDAAVSHHSHALTISSANHAARSGPDQQQQQQERHVHRRSPQTGRRLDKGDGGSGQSATAVPEPDQTAETPAGPGEQSAMDGSSHTWGIWGRDVHSLVDD